ncbi:TIGR03943 family protein [Bacillus sp. FJAT-29790]|uniref:TIGR03943 family putative permease subunit n=1 Tax=Bacillus sp. FJAT-29790 TaxID=1895002 RepID=UPI001C240896|nr:TIGR03943 family protein [Bacillus sp. FJAT-29790]MBU8880968.1 TIGR03943 family protein [Bacillus sp. FJAT-29790]
MKKIDSTVVHNFLRASILLSFFILIVYLLVTGDILYYISPELKIYAELAAAGLLVVTGFQYYIAFCSIKRPLIVCDCGHDHGHSHEPSRSIGKNIIIYGLFLFPLLLGFCLPNSALSSSLVDKKGINLGGGSFGKQSGELVQVDGNEDPVLKEMFKTDKYNRDYAKLGIKLFKQDVIELKEEWFMEKILSLDTFSDNFVGKKIQMKGFIYREPGMDQSQFILNRLVMTHCIADVAPFGIISEFPFASEYADDTWVIVTGTIGKTMYNDKSVMKIEVKTIEPIEAPKDAYVYPDWEFASKL